MTERAFVNFRRYGLFIALALVLTGCTSVESSSSTAERVKLQIQAVLPECKFESLKIPNGAVMNSSPIEFQAWLVPNEIVEKEPISALEADGTESWSKPPAGWRYFNQDQDQFFACHSLGEPLSSLNSFEDLFGPDMLSGDFCWVPNPDLVNENLRRLKACEERVEDVSKVGFWVVLRQAQDQEKLQQEIISYAEENLKYKYSLSPVLVSEGIAISLQGNFDDFNDATISNVDVVWQEIVEKTKSARISTYVSGYPDNFNLDDFPGRLTDRGSRKDISNGYARVSSYQACKNELKTSELNYSIGDCGKLNFEIFQADLNTGDCTFLGYWKDSQGVRRIGVVTFCDVYTQGSFTEGLNYKIGVRINGVTSYKTRLGYENSVLSFTAVR